LTFRAGEAVPTHERRVRPLGRRGWLCRHETTLDFSWRKKIARLRSESWLQRLSLRGGRWEWPFRGRRRWCTGHPLGVGDDYWPGGVAHDTPWLLWASSNGDGSEASVEILL